MTDREFWGGKRVFITGHTGFKGSWLSLWLLSLGSVVRGFSLPPPTVPSLFDTLDIRDELDHQTGDVRDLDALTRSMREFRPDVVFHLAAQPLVRESYEHPVETFATNVMGTVNLLEAIRKVESVRAVVVVTTDKCYENREWMWGYRETEAMGGHDPYSSSKGCAEIAVTAYRRSFLSGHTAVATARAGNVIGGGDWAKDRLIPDIVKAVLEHQPVIVRNPEAVRPWQHVVEPLSGYLLLARRLFEQRQEYAGPWNFGPYDEDARTVRWIVERLCAIMSAGAGYEVDDRAQPHEATYLKLDCSKARQLLGWKPKWSLEKALEQVADWARAYERGKDMRSFTLGQIREYESHPTVVVGNR